MAGKLEFHAGNPPNHYIQQLFEDGLVQDVDRIEEIMSRAVNDHTKWPYM